MWLFVEMLLMFEHIPPKSPISTQLASDPFYKKLQLKYNFKFILCGRLNHIVSSVKINGAQTEFPAEKRIGETARKTGIQCVE